MEYQFDMAFFSALYKELLHIYDEKTALHKVCDFAKVMMAGGLGSFKPDYTNALYMILKNMYEGIFIPNYLPYLRCY